MTRALISERMRRSLPQITGGISARAALTIAGVAVATITAGGQAGLPPRDAFLRDARENMARSQQLWHRYAYKERRTDLHTNPFGRLGTGGTRVLEVRPSPDPRLTYRRVLEINGVAVSQAELDRQDAEYRARLARAEREEAHRSDGDAARQQQHDLLARRRAQMMLDDVVNTLHFDLARREIHHGRPAIVVSFAAKPDARPTTREGRVARVFKGEIWVDEGVREVVSVKAAASDDVSFGGFIARIYEGTEVGIERREVEPGVWMPTRLTLTGQFRALFRRAKLDHHIEWFDYHKIR
jgi:hypothetical protein